MDSQTCHRSYLYGGVSADRVQFLKYAHKRCIGRLTISSKVIVLYLERLVSDLTIRPVLLKRFGIGVKFVESDDPAEFEKVIDEHTKGIYVESIGNPKYNVAPLPELAKVRQQHVVATLWSDVGTLRWRTIMVSR